MWIGTFSICSNNSDHPKRLQVFRSAWIIHFTSLAFLSEEAD